MVLSGNFVLFCVKEKSAINNGIERMSINRAFERVLVGYFGESFGGLLLEGCEIGFCREGFGRVVWYKVLKWVLVGGWVKVDFVGICC